MNRKDCVVACVREGVSHVGKSQPYGTGLGLNRFPEDAVYKESVVSKSMISFPGNCASYRIDLISAVETWRTARQSKHIIQGQPVFLCVENFWSRTPDETHPFVPEDAMRTRTPFTPLSSSPPPPPTPHAHYASDNNTPPHSLASTRGSTSPAPSSAPPPCPHLPPPHPSSTTH
jgi:hypothetical protein